MTLPEGAAQHSHAVGARLSFLVQECAPEYRVRAEHREDVRRGADARHVHRRVDARERVAQLAERGEGWNRARLRFPVDEGQRRDEIGVAVRVLLGQDNEPRRIAVRQVFQEDGLDDAEDRRVRADPEHQREDGDRRKGRLPAERPERVPNITQHVHDRRAYFRSRAMAQRNSNIRFAASRAVIWPGPSKSGATSTTSPPTRGRPARPRTSCCASWLVRPPTSRVPVPGANAGSTPSMSNVMYDGPRRTRRISSTVHAMPRAFT